MERVEAAQHPPKTAPAAFLWPARASKHLHNVADMVRVSTTSFIALTPTNGKDVRQVKQVPAATRSQSVPTSTMERSKISPKQSSVLAMEVEDWFITPSYVCSVHATTDGLTESYRHATVSKEEVIRVTVKESRRLSYTYISPMTFVLSSHRVTHEFKVEYSDYRKFVREMGALPIFAKSVSELEQTKLLEDSFSGSMRRAVASLEALTKDLAEALHALVQIPDLAAHPSFLKLAHIDSFRAIYEVLVHGESWARTSCNPEKGGETPALEDEDAESDTTEPMSLDGSQDCLCALYAEGASIFARHIANEELTFSSKSASNSSSDSDSPPSVEKVLCVDLMLSRSLLVFYTDSMFTLHKTNFPAARHFQECNIFGFGSRLLFQIKKKCKAEWVVVAAGHASTPLMTLKLQKHYSQKPVVEIYRSMASNPSGECIGQFRKSWKRGFEFHLLSELLTQGKMTTAITIASGVVARKHRFNVLCGVAGAEDPITSSALSVSPAAPTKQQLHVSEGVDVVLQLCIAAAFDIVAGAVLFHRSEFVY
ncbi:hypothetical protein AeRB84_020413 [Aphanomyces euteiches]|nr:hypothetical protein AeRB84_020413 [Aphanomyces euteiches]